MTDLAARSRVRSCNNVVFGYQSVVRNGDARLGLLIEGEELVAGCYHSYPMRLGTVVGVVPLGRGRVVFSTLDICSNLNSAEGPAEVARKLLCNFISAARGLHP